MKNINFGVALDTILKDNSLNIQRDGWNGKGLMVSVETVELVETVNSMIDGIHHTTLMIRYPDGSKFLWMPSPTDIIANDWSVL